MRTTYGRKFSFNRVQFKQTNNKYGFQMVDYCKQNNRCHHTIKMMTKNLNGSTNEPT